jgi:uncharacterized protein YbbC (DUF1343 family)
MRLTVFKNTVLLLLLIAISCGNISKSEDRRRMTEDQPLKPNDSQLETVVVGANQTQLYLPFLKGKKVGIIANQTSVIFNEHGYTHLVDSLVALKINVKAVFAPEHGFRGTADAGELIKDGRDAKTGISIISLYGDNKKPRPEQLQGLDVIIFDIQDVGARFYTYISTLHYVMEACAEAKVPIIIFDRPNPNGHYMDGPILEKEHQSFVGMHPIPVVHGMTIGEYAQMINGEKWLKNSVQCKITIIPIKHYTHQTRYRLPIKPSPNLPNDKAINLYPSLCFFEGTNVSVGRGTDKQFQVYGSPFIADEANNYCFTPKPNEGAKHPLYEGVKCCGFDLSNEESLNEIHLNYLIKTYASTLNKKDFFNTFFTKLAGTKKLQQQIEAGLTENEIKATWQKGLEQFKITRNNYLLYQ